MELPADERQNIVTFSFCIHSHPYVKKEKQRPSASLNNCSHPPPIPRRHLDGFNKVTLHDEIPELFPQLVFAELAIIPY